MVDRFSAAIQAGGKSSRMGTDKALVRLDGKPLIEHVIERLRLVQPAELLIISNTPLTYPGAVVYADQYKDVGPLGGIAAALVNARYDDVLIVACDMPFLNPQLLRFILDIQVAAHPYDAVVPRFQGQSEGLHALYHKSALPTIERRLKDHHLRLGDLFFELNTRFIDEPEVAHLDDGRSFTNVNTPDELRAAEETANG